MLQSTVEYILNYLIIIIAREHWRWKSYVKCGLSAGVGCGDGARASPGRMEVNIGSTSRQWLGNYRYRRQCHVSLPSCTGNPHVLVHILWTVITFCFGNIINFFQNPPRQTTTTYVVTDVFSVSCCHRWHDLVLNAATGWRLCTYGSVSLIHHEICKWVLIFIHPL